MESELETFHNAVKSVLDAFEAIRGNRLLRLRLERSELRSTVWREAEILADYAKPDGVGHDFFHVYTGIHAMLTILRQLQTNVIPVLRSELVRSGPGGGDSDRFMIQITLAGIDTNTARLLDALADLYAITRTRDIAQHGPQDAVCSEFTVLSRNSTWQVDPDLAKPHSTEA